MKLQGRVALITGAGRGIGRAIALKLAREGARIVLNDLDEDPAREVAGEIVALGGEVATCVGSVIDDGFAERFISTALDAFGGLDIIVNNAGFTWDSVIQKMTDEQFQAIMDVHVTAPFRILRAAATPIREFARREREAGIEHYRKVVNISSLSGLDGNAGQVNYAAAKAGVMGMTKSLAREWGRYRVTVNCVAFGFIQTRMTQPLDGEASTVAVGDRQVRYGVQSSVLDSLAQQVPMGRIGTPEDAADGVYLMCAPESNYITGQVLRVSGGMNF